MIQFQDRAKMKQFILAQNGMIGREANRIETYGKQEFIVRRADQFERLGLPYLEAFQAATWVYEIVSEEYNKQNLW